MQSPPHGAKTDSCRLLAFAQVSIYQSNVAHSWGLTAGHGRLRLKFSWRRVFFDERRRVEFRLHRRWRGFGGLRSRRPAEPRRAGQGSGAGIRRLRPLADHPDAGRAFDPDEYEEI